MTFLGSHTPMGKLCANPQELQGWGWAQEVGAACACTRTGHFQALAMVPLGFLATDTIASLSCSANESLQRGSHKVSVHSAGNPARRGFE